jgi:hypothetical protein
MVGTAALAAAVPIAAYSGPPEFLAVLACVSAAAAWGGAAGDAAPTWMSARPNLVRAGSSLVVATNLPVVASPVVASNLVTEVGQ